MELSTAIEGHKAESERLKQLTDFVARLAPAIGETSGFAPKVESSEEIESARDRAVSAAFGAIERIARLSFVPQDQPREEVQNAEIPRHRQRPI